MWISPFVARGPNHIKSLSFFGWIEREREEGSDGQSARKEKEKKLLRMERE